MSDEPSARHNGASGGDFLDQMRVKRESSGRRRSEREKRVAAPAARAPVRFEDLPEYKRVVAKKSASELCGVDNPFYRPHDAAAGATSTIRGEIVVNFASYDYLGTNQHAEIASAAKAAVERFGLSASASRLVAGERPVHAELEGRLASVYGTEAAVCFVSGYLTNATAISAILGPQDLVIHDELIHNSVLAGIKLSGAARRFFKHNDPADLEVVLKSLSGEFRRVLVIVEGVYSMDGDIADLPAFLDLRARYGFWLMVDEAHALGVLGATGRGTFEHFGVDPRQVDLWMGTLSKTTSSCGGYIAGCQALIDILKAEAGGFVYSVGLAPALAAGAIASLDVLARENWRVGALQENGKHFLRLAQKAGLDTGLSEGFSVVPVLVGDSLRAVQLSNELLESGVNVLPIIYPAVQEGMARLRFFITCDHTPEQMERAVGLTAEKLSALTERNFGLGSVDIAQLMTLMGG